MAVHMYHQTPLWGGWGQQLWDPRHALVGLAWQIAWAAISRALRPDDHKLGR